ncbi:DUF4331 family protein [Gaopeijia maritima]|uniref:DUF4331 family protein n=1 Tax=Gaopeijia maritima TaxID=3119007 RepID=UPI00324C4FF0
MPANRSQFLLRSALGILAVVGVVAAANLDVRAADHADSPDTSEGNLDANDLYVFARGDNLVFALTVSPLLAPGQATADAAFNPEGLYQFNLDRERDGVADAVIQVAFLGSGTDQMVDVRGPVALSGTSGTTMGFVSAPSVRAPFDQTVVQGGTSVFAGPRDDPFFIDLFGDMSVTSVLNAAFGAALGEQVGADNEQSLEFNPNATDDLAGLNTLAIVVEVPKSQVASALGITTSDAFFAWATTGIRQ